MTTQQENDKAWENEDNLYTQIKELVKGQRTSTVKNIIKRLDDTLLNISFVQ